MTATPSLRRRLTVLVLALLALSMVAMGIGINASLSALANRSVHERLEIAADRADSLVALGISAEQLSDHLNVGVIGALVVTADGDSFGDPEIEPDASTGGTSSALPMAPFHSSELVVHPLANGDRVILTVDTTESDETLRRLRSLMIAAGMATLVLASILLAGGSRVLLAPLDRLTDLARDITTGDRGRRLRPDRPKTELGRAADAFDGMLDELEASEKRAYLAAQRAQRAEAAMRRFLADAAHELRTPIAGMQAAAEQIAGNVGQQAVASLGAETIEPEVLRQHRRASLLLTEARRATRLVTDMLDLSYIDAGLPLELQDADLIGIVDHQLDRAALLAPQLRLVRTGLDAVSVRVDPTRVAQILSNLLDNARRHTLPGGQITVDVRSDEGVDNDGVVVLVTDTGCGVRDEDAERIFDRLVRLDSARDRDHGGAGLGLPIARALAVAHGGTLSCVPHQGGACFKLVIPGPSSADARAVRTPGG
ncbi:sensor histidine kinase [Mycolicibacter arupensis]|uniref:histidine kinase n=2 Tax=Mycolicibacter arupensis TaxID=342002 RepID=A0A0F5MYL8_9MYCO|nr:HAMP domain-containing sensor histidine kinase [Mycolicibacter arupensis]KKB99684.1 ATPase [Mycolicibacter arupensis]ORA01085.1 two-component sensor histidine kinase [Mycolicibacter arupensis]